MKTWHLSFLQEEKYFSCLFWNTFFFSKPDEKVRSPDSQKSSKQPEKWERTKLSTAIKTSPTMNLESLSFSPASGLQPLAPVQLCTLIYWYWMLWRNVPLGAQKNPCPRQLHLCFSQVHWNMKRAGGLSQTWLLRSKVGAVLAKGLGLEPAQTMMDRHTATASCCWPSEEQLQMLH